MLQVNCQECQNSLPGLTQIGKVTMAARLCHCRSQCHFQFLLNGNQKSIPRQMVRRIMAAILPPPIAAACNVKVFIPQLQLFSISIDLIY